MAPEFPVRRGFGDPGSFLEDALATSHVPAQCDLVRGTQRDFAGDAAGGGLDQDHGVRAGCAVARWTVRCEQRYSPGKVSAVRGCPGVSCRLRYSARFG